MPSSKEKNKSDETAIQFKEIRKQPIMWKFQFYGFFKNLQFFEPFIYIIFIAWGYSLFQIGILMFIRESITYILEIPSGILADNYGKKTELLLCFTFYIISFIFYFLGPNYAILIFGSIFYGLGEAFRSGTHKAMEMDWMERNELLDYKSFIYGQTRSWSLYGSALNSILAVVLVLILPADKWIFLIATLPFIADFILISTYPDYMNAKSQDSTKKIIPLFVDNFKNIGKMLKSRDLRKGILSSSSFDSIFKGIKDYIQPIMSVMIVFLINDFKLDVNNQDFYTKLILGIVYALFYFLSSFASRNSYQIDKLFKTTPDSYNLLFDVFGVMLLSIGIFYFFNISIGVIIVYLLIYMVYNLRRPLLIGYIGNLAPSEKRTTILSVESQSKSIMTAILAPLFGLIADYSIPLLFIIIAGLSIVINWAYFRRKGSIKQNNLNHEQS